MISRLPPKSLQAWVFYGILSREAAQVPEAIAELLEAVAEGAPTPDAAEHTLSIIACHSAVRAGQTLTLDEARELIRQLEKTTTPYTCPHGRPTMIHLSSAQLQRSFSRT